VRGGEGGGLVGEMGGWVGGYVRLRKRRGGGEHGSPDTIAMSICANKYACACHPLKVAATATGGCSTPWKKTV
jgi:hypothetical protein